MHWPAEPDPTFTDPAASHTEFRQDQTASLAPILLLASPGVPDMYSIDFALECTVAGIAGTLSATAFYTDLSGAVSATTATMLLTGIAAPAGRLSQRISFRLVGGDISFGTTMVGIVGSPKYNVTASARRNWSNS